MSFGGGGGDASGGSDESSVTDAIVFDIGSSMTKVGFSGEDSPRARYTSVVGLNTEKLDADLNSSIGSGGGGLLWGASKPSRPTRYAC